MLGHALAFAAEAHKDQKDKGGVAYILHPVRIAEALRRDNWSETHQVVAVLHDTVEDTNVTLKEVHEKFGSTIGEAVDAISRRGSWEPTGVQFDGEPEWRWEETYKEYIKRCCVNRIARVVKRYDVYDNADPRRYCDGVPVGRWIWTLDYLRELAIKEAEEINAGQEELDRQRGR